MRSSLNKHIIIIIIIILLLLLHNTWLFARNDMMPSVTRQRLAS